MTTAFISARQRGHDLPLRLSLSVQSTFAPQCEQNFAPLKIMPKHDGHPTVASRAPQCSHNGESKLATGAPHIGQFSVSADVNRVLLFESLFIA
jgi:hypothetical protein